MCIKVQKPLNPEAQEYRKQTPPPPPPPPPPMSLLLPPQLPHTLKLQPCFFRPRPRFTILTHYTYTHCTPHPTAPAHLYLPKAAPPPLTTENTEPAASPPPSDTKQRTVKSPKCPRRDVFKKGPRHLPPRIRKAILARAPASPPPPPTKQKWRPKVAANTDTGGAADSSPPSMTTLMIKNIPNQLRREFMLRFLDGYCKTHSVAYDFFYLPIDFKNPDNGNFGYAFVNFTTTAAAMKMKKILNKYKWRGTETVDLFHSKKICETTWARVQGKKALIRRFQTSKFMCSDEEFLPVVLDPPRNGSDPNPPPPVILGKLHYV